MDLWRSPGASRRCQTLQYAWQSVIGCVGKRMTTWNDPLVVSDSVDVDDILCGMGSFCERGRAHFQFGLTTPQPPRPKFFICLAHRLLTRAYHPTVVARHFETKTKSVAIQGHLLLIGQTDTQRKLAFYIVGSEKSFF